MRIIALLFLLIAKIGLAATAAPKSILEGSCVSSQDLRTGNISFDEIPCIVLNITNNILALVGYMSLFVILYGALLYVLSGVNEEFKSKGKDAVKYALVGAIISWSSWLIINFIIDNI